MDNELLSQGAALMALGMGVVFTFLTLLVFTTTIMSSVITRFFPETISAETAQSEPALNNNLPDQKTINIIQEAIRQHRNAP